MLLLLVYQIFVHTKIIANLLFPTSCVKCMESREKWEQDQALRPIISSYIEPCRTPLMKVVWLSGSDCFVACRGFGFDSSLSIFFFFFYFLYRFYRLLHLKKIE